MLGFPQGCVFTGPSLWIVTYSEKPRKSSTAAKSMDFIFVIFWHATEVPVRRRVGGWNGKKSNKPTDMRVAEFTLLLLSAQLPRRDLVTFLQPWHILLPDALIFGMTFKMYSGRRSRPKILQQELKRRIPNQSLNPSHRRQHPDHVSPRYFTFCPTMGPLLTGFSASLIF